jgi:hypothetical protein
MVVFLCGISDRSCLVLGDEAGGNYDLVRGSADHLPAAPGPAPGGATATPVEPAAGATGTLTATLSPTAVAGTAVNETLSVIDSTDFGGFEPAIGFPDSFSDFHDFAYAYTVGS